ncbi:hypothetical protein [Catenulispora sp. EB89]|uniref:hypothetical protein n=1 Tax=Catenulispora sp. EB89 TaxID=3156257 RepID=UPI0035156A1C
MGRKAATLATINRIPFRCQVCQLDLFFRKQVKLQVTGTLSGIEWSTALICARCGYVHLFMNDAIELWAAEGGYPQG